MRLTRRAMGLTSSLNAFLDTLPRTRVGWFGYEAPAFRTCGIVGYYLGLLVLCGGGLLAGRSLLVLAALALTSALSFYGYTYLRRWLTGREELVLLEHVWFALACDALALRLMGAPVLPYLDVVGVALCLFLAAGRVGCTLVGCCHGQPSSLGLTYDEACARDGFPAHLVGARLFPVPALEATGLLAIGASGLAALPFAEPGKVFAWYLLAYAVMRFGLEGIRGDRRPHFLGLSQARWMALMEFGLALGLAAGETPARPLAACAALSVVLLAVLAYRWRTDWRRALLAAPHLGELRQLARECLASRGEGPLAPPIARQTSRDLRLALSANGEGPAPASHLSLSLPDSRCDLPLLCELAARAFPGVIASAARFTGHRVLHVLVPDAVLQREADGPCGAAAMRDTAEVLYGSALRNARSAATPEATTVFPPPLPAEPGLGATASPVAPPGAEGAAPAVPWYFADVVPGNPRGA